jgi:DNA-binding transcriptional LysR family regulator
MPPTHRLVKKGPLAFKDLLPFPLVTVEPAGAVDRLLHEKAAALGAQLQVCVSLNSFDVGCRMVEAGFGISVKPRMAVELYAGRKRLVVRELKEEWARNEQRIYALRSTPRLRAVDALIEALQTQQPSRFAMAPLRNSDR